MSEAEKQQTILKEKTLELGRIGELIDERLEFPMQASMIWPYYEVKFLSASEASTLSHFDEDHLYFIEGDFECSANLHSESPLLIVNGNLHAKNLVIDNGSVYVNGNLTLKNNLLCFGDSEKPWLQKRNLLYVSNHFSVQRWLSMDYRSLIDVELSATEIFIFDKPESFNFHPAIIYQNIPVTESPIHLKVVRNNLHLQEILSPTFFNRNGYYDREIIIEALLADSDIFANSKSLAGIKAEKQSTIDREQALKTRFKQRLKQMDELGETFFSRSEFPCFHNGYTEVDTEWIEGNKPLTIDYTRRDANYFIDGDLIHEDTLELDCFLTVVDGNLKVKNLIINRGSLYVSGNLEVTNVLYATSEEYDENQSGNLLYIAKQAHIKHWINHTLEAHLHGGLSSEKIIVDSAYQKLKYIPQIAGKRLSEIPELQNKTTYDADNHSIYANKFMQQVEFADDDIVHTEEIVEWLQSNKSLF